MANEKITENPAEKSAEKASESGAGKSSGRRSGRRGRPQGGQQNRPQDGREGGQPDRSQGGRRNVQPDKPQGERQGRQQAGRRPGSSGRSGNPARPSDGRAVKIPAFNWTWRDYVLQLSVVVIGVMVTFIGSGLVGRWREAREVRTVMQLVYEELKTNRIRVESICNSLSYDRRGMVLLSDYRMDYTRIPVDSLEKYQLILGRIRKLEPRTDALEILRSFGSVTSVEDKTMLLDILECYSWMNSFSGSVVTYNEQKMNTWNHLFSNGMNGTIGGADPVESWRTMMDDTVCAAFLGTMSNYFGEELLSGGGVRKIDRVTEMLNEKYRFERQDTQK